MDLTRKKKPRKRAFKACVLCRFRKAKCEFENPGDLGVVPCLRCKSEGEQCQFLPTRRGGNYGNGHTARRAREQEAQRRASQIAESQNQIDQVLPIEEEDDDDDDDARDDNAQVDVQQIAEAPLRNPSDALEILARTTSPPNRNEHVDSDEDGEGDEDMGTGEQIGTLHEQRDRTRSTSSGSSPHGTDIIENGNGTGTAESMNDRQALKNINNFLLIKLGLITPIQLRTYVSIFISRHNYYLPIIPEYRLPNNDHRLGQFAVEESFLLMVIVIIVTRYEKDSAHEVCWKFTRCHLSGITYGGLPTVGVVEGLLLLSEHLPKLPGVADSELHRVEAFMSWNLVGLAVRFSYFLGFDQNTLLHPTQVYDEQTSRERLAWTYCYVFDRQVSIRLGKAFWSRGPGLCFQNPPEAHMNINLEAHNNFPTLASNGLDMPMDNEYTKDLFNCQNPGVSIGDNSSLVQAYVELTQILTNIHDTLYPSRDRTIALVRIGEYYRMLDEFTRTFTGFCITWKDKHRWKNFPLNETVWATFHFTKLYAYSFAFQAHVQRAITKSKVRLHNGCGTSETLAELIFPRGLTGCPDAKFILEGINAASELLKICVNDLCTQGALAFLPSRFYGYFSYAAVFLIKVVLTEAVVACERERILLLVGKTITAFQSASSKVDKQHLGVRSTRQLKTLLRTLIMATGTSMANTPNNMNHFSPAPTEQQLPDIPHSLDDNYALWLELLEVSPLMDPAAAGLAMPMNNVETPLGWGSEACAQELPALLGADLDSEMWLSMF